MYGNYHSQKANLCTQYREEIEQPSKARHEENGQR
jgi:hypothetical protein